MPRVYRAVFFYNNNGAAEPRHNHIIKFYCKCIIARAQNKSLFFYEIGVYLVVNKYKIGYNYDTKRKAQAFI